LGVVQLLTREYNEQLFNINQRREVFEKNIACEIRREGFIEKKEGFRTLWLLFEVTLSA